MSDLGSRLKAFVITYHFILSWKYKLEGVLTLIVMLLLRFSPSLCFGGECITLTDGVCHSLTKDLVSDLREKKEKVGGAGDNTPLKKGKERKRLLKTVPLPHQTMCLQVRRGHLRDLAGPASWVSPTLNSSGITSART